MTTNLPSPSAIYVEVLHKFEDPDNYEVTDAIRDLKKLFHALGAELRTNQNLEARVKSQQTLLDEQGIEIFNNGFEIYNLKAEIDRLTTESEQN